MIYAFIGEETLLASRALEKLLRELLPESARDFNFDAFEGNQAEAGRLMEAVRTFPVFADARVVLVSNAQDIRKPEADQLSPFLADVPESTHLIFVAASVDRRMNFWKGLLEKAKVQEFKPIAPREVAPWIVGEARQAGYQVSSEAADWMASALGTDLSLIQSTLEKVALAAGPDKKIGLALAESCIAAFSWKNVFELSEAVGRKDLGRSLLLFKKMFSEGESPIALLALLARHFRILLKVKEGVSAGVPPYFLKDYQKQAGAFSKPDLMKKMEFLFETDRSLKSSALSSQLIFERLLTSLCR